MQDSAETPRGRRKGGVNLIIVWVEELALLARGDGGLAVACGAVAVLRRLFGPRKAVFRHGRYRNSSPFQYGGLAFAGWDMPECAYIMDRPYPPGGI